jgi:tRNA pseudouridine55 synthase
MARRRKKSTVHGWLNVNKPVGMSSASCVAVIRKIFGGAKVGHAGTLDPLASGVLPIALGEATKTVSILQDGRKRYSFTICWGERRSTDDAEGEIIATSPQRPTEAGILAALPKFTGRIEQVPPAFSAIKVDGARAYALARDGVDVELAPREVEIDELTLISCTEVDRAELQVISGKGMYVRSLARDLAVELNTEGYLGRLVREAVGPFELNTANSLELLEQLGHSAAAFEQILPIETALADIPALALSADEATRLRNGQAVPIMRPADRDTLNDVIEDEPILATAGGKSVALVRADGIQIRPVRVFNFE